MGPQDHLRAFLDGTAGSACTVCDEPVPVERIRLLAQRDDLAFIELDCPACGSTGLGFVGRSTPSGSDDRPTAAHGDAVRRPARGLAPEATRLAGAPAISADDVLDMHTALAGWTGDLVGLLNDVDADERSSPRRAHPGRARAGGRSARSTGRPT